MAKSTKKWAVSALVAGAAGYVAGILTAPKSGKETRKDIKEAAGKAKSEAERKLKQLHSDLDDMIGKGKTRAKSLQATAQRDLGKLIDKAQMAKDKARALLSALHEGDADDKDLQKVIKEVNDALDHLKNYLHKDGQKTSK